jgi:hypothetical protein
LVRLDANRLTIKPNGQQVTLGFDVAKDVKVSIADEPARAAELKPDAEVVLTLSPDSRTVLAIQTWGEDEDGVVKTVDAAAGTVEVTAGEEARVLAGAEGRRRDDRRLPVPGRRPRAGDAGERLPDPRP